LSYFNDSNKHSQYRKKVQQYANEEKRLLEDLHHSMILGTEDFVDRIRKQFLPGDLQDALPQQKKLAKDIHFDEMVKEVASILQIDMALFGQAKRLYGTNKHKRDLMIYFLWNQGLKTNDQIGRLFGISGSAVSHSVKNLGKKMKQYPDVKKQLDRINLLFERYAND
jgi:chromosomal replication initiation ATPase DnaA